MEFNQQIFPNGFLPAQSSSYTFKELQNDIIFVPRIKTEEICRQDEIPIPCLYLPCTEGSSKLLILFHGNAEDIGHVYALAKHISLALKVHVLVPEYPGYGIY